MKLITTEQINAITDVNSAGRFLEEVCREIEKKKENLKPLQLEINKMQEFEAEVKKRVMMIMEEQVKKEIKTDRYRFLLSPNAPSVNILDESLIPEQYIRTKEVKSVDKKAIMQEWKENEIEVNGTEIIRNFRLKVETRTFAKALYKLNIPEIIEDDIPDFSKE